MTTHIAPFIGFLAERRRRKSSYQVHSEAISSLGPIDVIFGCRNKDSFLYKSELDSFKADKTLVSSYLRPNKPKIIMEYIYRQSKHYHILI